MADDISETDDDEAAEDAGYAPGLHNIGMQQPPLLLLPLLETCPLLLLPALLECPADDDPPLLVLSLLCTNTSAAKNV